MKTALITFPDDTRIDEPYRGKNFVVRYKIKIEESGMITSLSYIDGMRLGGYTAEWTIDTIRAGRPIETLAENAASGRPRSQWPADD